MKKTISLIFKGILGVEFIVRLMIMVIAFAIILLTAYFLGYPYLQSVRGNDAMNAYSIILWFARWWPKIPFWYPQQGAGMSFVFGYPILPSLMVIMTSILAKINLWSSMEIVGFFSMPITAIGMYLFVWRRLKNQSAAFISAIMYLLMPISWVWLFDWGFYAEHIAYIFIFPSLIFYDSFLDEIVEGKNSVLGRISLLGSVIFLGLSFAAHPSVYFTIIKIIGIYSFVYVIWKDRGIKLKRLAISITVPFIILVVSSLAAGFMTGNYLYYGKISGSASVQAAYTKEDFEYYYNIPFRSILGLEKIPQDNFKFALRNVVISMSVWLPATLGVLAIFISGKVFGLALIAGFSILLLKNTTLLYYLASAKIPFFNYFFSLRSEILTAKILLPIVAAFGISALPHLVILILTFWIKIKNEILRWLIQTIKSLLVGGATLALGVYVIFYFSNKPDGLWGSKDQIRYGPYSFNIRDPFNQFGINDSCSQDIADKNFCDRFKDQDRTYAGYLLSACSFIKNNQGDLPKICDDFLDPKKDIKTIYTQYVIDCNTGEILGNEQYLCPIVQSDGRRVLEKLLSVLKDKNYWQKPNLSGNFEFPIVSLNDFNKEYGNDQYLRIDTSPTSGGATQSINMVNKASIINIYTAQLNLIGPYWGYQQQAMYSEYDNRHVTVDELGKWFGTKFVLLNPGLDALDKFRTNEAWKAYDENEIVWEFIDAPKLWTLTENKAAILVIGDLQKRAYEPVFRAANKGALPYDEYILVQGDEFLDSYSQEELQKFDVLMLFGHKYKNRNKAYKLLDKFVKNGGSLFISTGWEYIDADWKFGKYVPDFFPAKKANWSVEFGKSNKMNFNYDLLGKLDTSKFGPLVWSDTGWGVSVMSDLRPWAKPVLEVDGKPIIVAGSYGEGKVVMSGLNLIGHMHSYEYNDSEISFYKAVFNWLKSTEAYDHTDIISTQRDYPDKIVFKINENLDSNSELYFRESFYPDWKATLTSGKNKETLTIYRAGPGFKLMLLPKLIKGDTIALELRPGLRNTAWIFLSVVVYLALIIYIFAGERIHNLVFNILTKKLKEKKKKLVENWKKEEEY